MELVQFNVVFAFLSVLYLIVYLSNHYLVHLSSTKLQAEQQLKVQLEEDFKDFKRGINANLLYESLETVLDRIDSDAPASELIIDQLARLYRYILTIKERQLVPFKEEAEMLEVLIELLNLLPYRKVTLHMNTEVSGLVIPGSFLIMVQELVRSSILSASSGIELHIEPQGDMIELRCDRVEKFNIDNYINTLAALRKSYSIYTDSALEETTQADIKLIHIPLLKTLEPLI